MRWLIAHPGPNFSVADVYVGWVEALRELGEDVYEFNLDDRLAFYDGAYQQVPGRDDVFRRALTAEQAIELAVNGLAAALYKIRPHVLMLVSGFFTDMQMLDQARRYGTKVVVLNTESPYEDDRQLKLAEHADLMLLNDPLHLEQYQAITNATYCPHAYRPAVHCPGPARYPVADFSFVGTGYPSRIAFFGDMNLDGLDVVLAGNWLRLDENSPLRKYIGHDIKYCCDNSEAVEIYRSTRVGINLYRREANDKNSLFGLAMGPREVEMAACGVFFLRDSRPESDQVLSMLPRFGSPGEAGELLRWYLRHADQRIELAAAARQAIAERTFVNHATNILRLFDRQPVTTS